MEPTSPPPKRTPAPRTPVGARNLPKAPTPGRSHPAAQLFEDYAAFARAARRAAAAVGARAAPGERRDAVADVCDGAWHTTGTQFDGTTRRLFFDGATVAWDYPSGSHANVNTNFSLQMLCDGSSNLNVTATTTTLTRY